MSLNIHHFRGIDDWKMAIFEKLDKFSNGSNIIIPGGETPNFLYEEYFLRKNFRKFILSDERITSDKNRSNYLKISNTIKTFVFQLCDFPINGYKEININQISRMLLELQHPNIALLGIGSDGHYASIFKSMEIIKTDKANNLKIISTDIEGIPEYRITLSENYIKKTKEIMFIAKGKNKYELIKKIESKSAEVADLPISDLISSYNGNLNIMYCIND